jgi:hypothetical protein
VKTVINLSFRTGEQGGEQQACQQKTDATPHSLLKDAP